MLEALWHWASPIDAQRAELKAASATTCRTHMIRQNSEALVAQAFRLIDEEAEGPLLLEIPPDLVPPRTIFATPFDLG